MDPKTEREQYVLFHAPRYHTEILTADAVLCARDPHRAPIPPDQAALAALGRAAALWDRRSLIPQEPSTAKPLDARAEVRADAVVQAAATADALRQQGQRAGYVVYASRRLRDALQGPAPWSMPTVEAAHRELCAALEPYDQPISGPHGDDAQRVAAALDHLAREADRLAERAAEAEGALRQLVEAARRDVGWAAGEQLAAAMRRGADLLGIAVPGGVSP